MYWMTHLYGETFHRIRDYLLRSTLQYFLLNIQSSSKICHITDSNRVLKESWRSFKDEIFHEAQCQNNVSRSACDESRTPETLVADWTVSMWLMRGNKCFLSGGVCVWQDLECVFQCKAYQSLWISVYVKLWLIFRGQKHPCAKSDWTYLLPFHYANTPLLSYPNEESQHTF